MSEPGQLRKLLEKFGYGGCADLPPGGTQAVLQERLLILSISALASGASRFIKTRDILAHVPLDAVELAKRLKPCGLAPRKWKTGPTTTCRGYSRQEFADTLHILRLFPQRNSSSPVQPVTPPPPPPPEPQPMFSAEDLRQMALNQAMPRKKGGLNFSVNHSPGRGRYAPEWRGL